MRSIYDVPSIEYTSQKPGVGKSTAAILQSCAWAQAGRSVFYVDGDPTSQTATTWLKAAKKSGDPLPFRYITAPHGLIVEEAEEHYNGEDIVVLDIAGGSHTIARAAAKLANVIILGTTLSPMDWELIPPMKKEIEAGLSEHNRDVKSVERFVLFGRVDARRYATMQRRVASFAERGLSSLENHLTANVRYENVKNKNPLTVEFDLTEAANINKELEEFLW